MKKQSLARITKAVLIVAVTICITVFGTLILNDLAFRHTEGVVYKTKTGECYHASDCGYLWNSAIPIGEEKAQKSGLRRCSRCGGESSGIMVVDNYPLAACIVVLSESAVALSVQLFRYMLYARNEKITEEMKECSSEIEENEAFNLKE